MLEKSILSARAGGKVLSGDILGRLSRLRGSQCQRSAEMLGLVVSKTRVKVNEDWTTTPLSRPPPRDNQAWRVTSLNPEQSLNEKSTLKACCYGDTNSSVRGVPPCEKGSTHVEKMNERQCGNGTVGHWDRGEDREEELNGMDMQSTASGGYLSPQSVICPKWWRPQRWRWPGSPPGRPAAAGPGLGCPYQLSPATTKQS